MSSTEKNSRPATTRRRGPGSKTGAQHIGVELAGNSAQIRPDAPLLARSRARSDRPWPQTRAIQPAPELSRRTQPSGRKRPDQAALVEYGTAPGPRAER